MMIDRRSFIVSSAAAALAPGFTARGSDRNIPVLFDTDIGTDIDDALTVCYLLAQPRCELVGVTTNYGDTVARARLVSVLCTAAGREEVPILAGSSELMDGKVVEGKVPQAEVLPDWPHQKKFTPGQAVPFMREAIESRPGEIVLLAVGALTNVARLFQEHPETAGKLKGLYIMNGSFRRLMREYNASRDSLATKIVYETDVREFVAVDFETSFKCRITAKEARQRFQGGPLDAAAAMAEVWFRTLPLVVFYDSLTAAVIFEPGLCEYKQAKVVSRAGWTFPMPDKDGPHKISVDTYPERFKEHYFGAVKVFKS